MLVDTISTNIFSTVYAWYSHSIKHPIFQYNQSFLWLKYSSISYYHVCWNIFCVAEAPGYDPDSVLSKNTGLPLAYASVYGIPMPTTSRSSRRYGRHWYLIFRRSNICPIHDTTMKITVTVISKWEDVAILYGASARVRSEDTLLAYAGFQDRCVRPTPPHWHIWYNIVIDL